MRCERASWKPNITFHITVISVASLILAALWTVLCLIWLTTDLVLPGKIGITLLCRIFPVLLAGLTAPEATPVPHAYP